MILDRVHPGPTGTLLIRPLTAHDELVRCVELQRMVWGYSDLDVMPVRVFVFLRQIGGLVLGAYDGDTLVGFVNSVPGADARGVYWQSHMLAVLPERQNRGIGTMLKRAQREQATAHGARAIRWVFDPLRPKNGYVNLVKLGAIGTGYLVNHYGASSSPLHRLDERDLVVAEWQLAGPAVPLAGETRTIAIPEDVWRLDRACSGTLRATQLRVRTAFLGCLADGFVATGLERDGDGWAYVLHRRIDEAAIPVGA